MLEIYGTLGPACSSEDLLEQMLAMGMTGVRLNLSHVTLAQAADQVEALHTAAQRLGVQPNLLIDMQGPELRIGKVKTGAVVREGDEVKAAKNDIIARAILDILSSGKSS